MHTKPSLNFEILQTTNDNAKFGVPKCIGVGSAGSTAGTGGTGGTCPHNREELPRLLIEHVRMRS